ncbi:hypothetical protein MLPF_3366 [Mycobacterium lepromatosis]|nr:hypothetical protein MLPF_2247 [Mycobacterium lepromatosis]UKN43154.1 hypothetical protein MLPF_3366 [Mycobacterium lepromatosis]
MPPAARIVGVVDNGLMPSNRPILQIDLTRFDAQVSVEGVDVDLGAVSDYVNTFLSLTHLCSTALAAFEA